VKLYVLYHPQSETARQIEEFVHNFERQRGGKAELISLDTREGWSMASLYDIVGYPAILAVANDGQMLKSWEGEVLPLMDEVAAYETA
jgi:thioredoxin-like negative regulator of GroEL